jgi:hypothetical protein
LWLGIFLRSLEIGSPAILMIEAFLAPVSAEKSNEFNAPVQIEQGLSSKLRETLEIRS